MIKNKSVQFIGRLVSAIIVFGITAFFTPGFSASSFWIVAFGVLVLILLDFFISSFTRLYSHPFAKACIGFVLCIVSLYIVQYAILGYTSSWISTILGALVYAIVDYMLPSEN